MKTTSQNRLNLKSLAIGACAALVVGAPALTANATSVYEDPVSITVAVPTIETEQDRQDAIDNFRKKAMEACEVNGTRGLGAMRYQTLCADDLVKVYTTKIDASLELAQQKELTETSDT